MLYCAKIRRLILIKFDEIGQKYSVKILHFRLIFKEISVNIITHTLTA